jgi:hypothetical protein
VWILDVSVDGNIPGETKNNPISPKGFVGQEKGK